MCVVVKSLVPIVLVILSTAVSVAAKDWRGILPMHSTRAHVEALLGLPRLDDNEDKSNKTWWHYSLDEAEVYIAFTDQNYVASIRCDWIGAGVVSVIRVTPKNDKWVKDLNLDEKIVRKFKASGSGHEGFIDEKEGLILRAYEGKVQEMVYIASASDRQRCQDFYREPERLVELISCGLPFKFDEYGNLSFSDEKARLDNFAIQLINEEKSWGYIIVYAGRKATLGEAQRRADRAKDYLVRVRKISPGKIVTVDGGHHEDLTVQLFVLPPNFDTKPLVHPTVDPSDVEILSEKKTRSRKRK